MPTNDRVRLTPGVGAQSIRNHEAGDKHKEKVEWFHTERRNDKHKAEREESQIKKQMREIEKVRVPAIQTTHCTYQLV